MSDIFDELADIVGVIKSDSKLKDAFRQVLKFGTSTQQVRVKTLLTHLEKLGAPEKVRKFVLLLGDDKFANQVLREIERE